MIGVLLVLQQLNVTQTDTARCCTRTTSPMMHQGRYVTRGVAAPRVARLVMASWAAGVRAVLLDVSGVLYDSGGPEGGAAIPGSVQAVDRIRQAGLKLRFCTNESQATRSQFVCKLQRFGFNISEEEVTAPGPAANRLMQERGLRPHLLVHDDLLPEFDSIDKSEPNCVVIGDAAENFSYQNVNQAFTVLIGLEKPILISLGKGRYYKETDGLKLDVGAYMKALEYACDVSAEVVGKPSNNFFMSALDEMGVKPNEAVMIGDDVVNDIGGAQSCGIRAILVRTGKYRPSDEKHPQVTADGYVDNLAHAVDILLASKGAGN